MDCISCAALRVVLTAKFGSGTENVVKKYQGKKGLTQDGIVGDEHGNALVNDIKTIQQLPEEQKVITPVQWMALQVPT